MPDDRDEDREDVRDRPLVIRNGHGAVAGLALLVQVLVALSIGWLIVRQGRQDDEADARRDRIERKLDGIARDVETIRTRVAGE